jgi:hypothetical protein
VALSPCIGFPFWPGAGGTRAGFLLPAFAARPWPRDASDAACDAAQPGGARILLSGSGLGLTGSKLSRLSSYTNFSGRWSSLSRRVREDGKPLLLLYYFFTRLPVIPNTFNALFRNGTADACGRDSVGNNAARGSLPL